MESDLYVQSILTIWSVKHLHLLGRESLFNRVSAVRASDVCGVLWLSPELICTMDGLECMLDLFNFGMP
jgi:hypothetical protein